MTRVTKNVIIVSQNFISVIECHRMSLKCPKMFPVFDQEYKQMHSVWNKHFGKNFKNAIFCLKNIIILILLRTEATKILAKNREIIDFVSKLKNADFFFQISRIPIMVQKMRIPILVENQRISILAGNCRILIFGQN